jgi:hypothetical protein
MSLDIDEPIGGWEQFFEARNITVMDDALGRPLVARYVLGNLIAEHKEREARQASRPQLDPEPSPPASPRPRMPHRMNRCRPPPR